MLTTRRTFFQIAAMILPPILFNPFSFFRSLFAPDGELRPVKRIKPNPFTRRGKTLVGIVKGKEIDAMIREAIGLIGGLERLKVKGKTVLVKPNILSGGPPPTTTNPKVVAGVVRLFSEAGAARVIVGDMSGLVVLPTRANLEKTGIAKAAREAGAEVIDFDDADWIEVKPPEVRLVRSIHIAKPVYEADLLVNLPVIKTHRSAVYSICLKNLVGITHPRYRPYRVNPARWEEVVAELNLAAHPDLNIVDATTVMVADGPWEGEAEKTGMILASGDRIAADAVGLGLIKHFDRWPAVADIGVWEQRQIRHAQRLRLGLQDKAALEIATRLLEGDRAAFDTLIGRIRDFLNEEVPAGR